MEIKMQTLQSYAVQHQKLVCPSLPCAIALKMQTASAEQFSSQEHKTVPVKDSSWPQEVCTCLGVSVILPSGHCYKYQCVTIWPVWFDKCLEKSLPGFLVALHDSSATSSWCCGLGSCTQPLSRVIMYFPWSRNAMEKKILQKTIPAWCTGWMNHCDRLTMSLLCKVKCNVWEQRPR